MKKMAGQLAWACRFQMAKQHFEGQECIGM